MHTAPLSLHAIDALLDGPRRLSSFTTPEVLQNGKLAMTLAAITWLTPLPPLLTPLSLSTSSTYFTYNSTILYATYGPFLLFTFMSITIGIHAYARFGEAPDARFSTMLRAIRTADMNHLAVTRTVPEGQWGRARMVLRGGLREEADREGPGFVLGNVKGEASGVVRYG